MKKLAYFLVLMSAFTLLSVSCTKTTNDTPTVNSSGGFITLNQLNGTWKTCAYIYSDVRYKYVISTSNPTQIVINDYFRTFTFYAITEAVDYTWIVNPNAASNHYDFIKDVNDIKFVDNFSNFKEKYTVVDFSNDTLRLKFTFKDMNPNLKTGIYLLHK